MLSFGQRLKMLRREAELSQADLAEAIGVSVQSVSKWECDSNMPDVSMLLPLSSVLGVTADCLLGAGTNEKEDAEALEKEVDAIWHAYHCGNYEDNASYKVYQSQKNFLKKYPLNYAVKLESTKSLDLFLYRSAVRGHYEIPAEEFDSLWNEGVKALKSIVNQDKDPSRQLEARFELIEYYDMKKMWDEAEEIAGGLPDFYGRDLKGLAQKVIASAKHDYPRANELQEKLSYDNTCLFLDGLWARARSISIFGNVRKEEAIAAWGDAVRAAKVCLEIFGGVSWEKYKEISWNMINPLQNMACDYLAIDDVTSALDCCEEITGIVEDVFGRYDGSEAEDEIKDEKKWLKFSLHGCFDSVFDEDDNILTREERFKACQSRLDALK